MLFLLKYVMYVTSALSLPIGCFPGLGKSDPRLCIRENGTGFGVSGWAAETVPMCCDKVLFIWKKEYYYSTNSNKLTTSTLDCDDRELGASALRDDTSVTNRSENVHAHAYCENANRKLEKRAVPRFTRTFSLSIARTFAHRLLRKNTFLHSSQNQFIT